MTLSKAIELVDQGINLEAAKRKILSSRKMCDNLLSEIERKQNEEWKQAAKLRSETYSKDPDLVLLKSKIKTAYLESFLAISHSTEFLIKLGYEGIENDLTEYKLDKIKEKYKGDLVAQLDEVLKQINK